MFEFLGLVGTSSLVLICFLSHAKRTRDFDGRWPPISDDEFIAKCDSGVNRERALKVRRVIAEQLGVRYEQIHPEQSFVDDLSCC